MNNRDEIPEDDEELEKEGLSKTTKIGIGILITILAAIAIYFIIGKSDKVIVNKTEVDKNNASSFSENDDIELTRKLNAIPDIVAPSINNSLINIRQPSPPPKIDIPQIKIPKPEVPIINPEVNKTTNELPQLFGPVKPTGTSNLPQQLIPQLSTNSSAASLRKRNASVFAVGGAANEQPETQEEREKRRLVDMISGRSNKLYTTPSGFPKVADSFVGLKDRMILAGKMIDIVLESRINTAQEGMMRAMVTTDVYSESGHNILIPAGSRVTGTYSGSKKRNMYTVEVALNRVVRPDGVDVLLGGMAISDKLGGLGIRPDKVYTGIGKTVMRSVLTGALSLGALFGTQAIDKALGIEKNKTTVQTIPNTNTSIVTTPVDDSAAVVRDIINNMTSDLKSMVDNSSGANDPIFIVNQGRAMSIMTDKDIVFNDENAFIFNPGEINALLKDGYLEK